MTTNLTERQLDVLRLVALGYDYREVADQLGISHGAVKTHMSDILARYRVWRAPAAVALAIARGELDVDEDEVRRIERRPF